MFEQLPSETEVFQVLLAELHDDLAGRVNRLRLLTALEYDHGNGRRLIIPGGTPAYSAYVETRQAFVSGNFLSVILLSQCVMENILAAQVGIESVASEIRGGKPSPEDPRPTFRRTLKLCGKMGLIDPSDEENFLRLSNLRNALAHFRSVNDQSHIDRRAITERRTAAFLCENDARFAITLFVRILSKPAFRLGIEP